MISHRLIIFNVLLFISPVQLFLVIHIDRLKIPCFLLVFFKFLLSYFFQNQLIVKKKNTFACIVKNKFAVVILVSLRLKILKTQRQNEAENK